MAYMYFGKKKIASIHDRLVLKINRCFEETDVLEWMTKGKTMIKKDTPKRIYTQRQLIHKSSMYDMENPNRRDLVGNLLVASKLQTVS